MPIIKLLSDLSRYFNFDILWRISQRLRTEDRRAFAWRLLQQEADQVTFRRGQTMWTGSTWDSCIMPMLFTRGSYQISDIEALASWLKHRNRITSARNVILDVGANIGTTAIPFAQQTPCHILAIEPVPENFQLLKKNISQNGLDDRITCVQKAVFNHPAEIEMLLPDLNCGGAFIKSPKQNGQTRLRVGIRETVSVPADTLENIVAEQSIQTDQIVFVWCDTEGSEAVVIETGESLWLCGVPLYMELFPNALADQAQLDTTPAVIARYFDRFVESRDLIQYGVKAPLRSVTELPALIEELQRIEDGITDILLLPKETGNG